MADEQQHEMSEYEQARERIRAEREDKEQLAHRLASEADQHWQKAIVGLFALPTAIALRLAATTLYAVGFLSRGFEVFQRSMEARERRPNGGWRQGAAQQPH
jgi:hypothetical protein